MYDMLDVWRKYESMDRGTGTTIKEIPVEKDILLRTGADPGFKKRGGVQYI